MVKRHNRRLLSSKIFQWHRKPLMRRTCLYQALLWDSVEQQKTVPGCGLPAPHHTVDPKQKIRCGSAHQSGVMRCHSLLPRNRPGVTQALFLAGSLHLDRRAWKEAHNPVFIHPWQSPQTWIHLIAVAEIELFHGDIIVRKERLDDLGIEANPIDGFQHEPTHPNLMVIAVAAGAGQQGIRYPAAKDMFKLMKARVVGGKGVVLPDVFPNIKEPFNGHLHTTLFEALPLDGFLQRLSRVLATTGQDIIHAPAIAHLGHQQLAVMNDNSAGRRADVTDFRDHPRIARTPAIQGKPMILGRGWKAQRICPEAIPFTADSE